MPRQPPSTGRELTRAEEPRFSEQELALILKKAAELQEGGARPAGTRFSLSEIQEIAAEAGISPSSVAAAAAVVRDRGTRGEHLMFGAPWRFRYEQAVEGEVSDDVVGEMVDIVRRELGLQGKVNEALSAVEWTARDSFGSTHVTVTRRSGRTTIAVLSARTDAVTLVGVFGGLGAVFGTGAAVAILIATAGLAAPVALPAAAVGVGSGVWLSMRGTWRRAARRYTERVATLGELLLAHARQAVDEGKVADSAP